MSTLIIKGALYFDGDQILRAHYTGQFYVVDCTEYKTKQDIKSEYDKAKAREILSEGYRIVYDGVTYYETGDFGPRETDGLELISDLDTLEYFDENSQF